LPVGEPAAASLGTCSHQLTPGFVTVGTMVLVMVQAERGWGDRAERMQLSTSEGPGGTWVRYLPGTSIPMETSEAAV